MTLHVVGDSHVVALARAWESRTRDSTIPAPRFAKLFSFPQALKPFHRCRVDGSVELLDSAAAGLLAEGTGCSDWQSGHGHAWAVSLAYTTTIFLLSDTWTRYRPWPLAQSPMHALSDRVMSTLIEEHFKHVLQFLDDLITARVAFLVFEAPPLRRDALCIGRGLFDAHSALEMDSMCRQQMDRLLAARGITIVPCPAESYDGNVRSSFLRLDLHDSYYDGDGHHANATYGRWMLDRVLTAAAHVERTVSFRCSLG